MAVANTKSTAVSNADAYPASLSQPHLAGNYIRQAVGTVEMAASDSATSVYRLARLRSSDRVSSIGLAYDQLASSGTLKLGLLRTKADGGGVIASGSDGVFNNSLSAGSALAGFANQAWSNNDIANAEKRLWELFPAVWTKDPGVDLDVAVTLSAVTSGTGGTISAHVTYVSGN